MVTTPTPTAAAASAPKWSGAGDAARGHLASLLGSITVDTILIDAPSEVVWSVYTEVNEWPQWTASVATAHLDPDGPLAIGSRATIKQPRFPTVAWTVTSIGRPLGWLVRRTTRRYLRLEAEGLRRRSESNRPPVTGHPSLTVQRSPAALMPTTSTTSAASSPTPTRRPWILVAHGIGAALLLSTALQLFGDTPDTRAGDEAVADHFTTHRTSILTGTWLLTGWFAWFTWQVLSRARNTEHAGSPRLATALRTTSTITAAVYLTAIAGPYLALSYAVASDTPTAAKPLFLTTLTATAIIAWPLAITLLVAGVGVLRTGRRRAILELALGVTLSVATVAVAARGPLSPDVQQQVVYGTLALWTLTLPAGGSRPGWGRRRDRPPRPEGRARIAPA